jgi:Fic family protein
MNPDRFQNSSAGAVIHVGEGETAYWAFVPHPLPPRIAFDGELVYALSAADRALGELAGLGRTLPNSNLLIQPFIRREAVLSSRIEGTQADIADVFAYEARHLGLIGEGTLVKSEDAHEVVNYVIALQNGLERLEALPVSLRLIREIHGRLMEGVRGNEATPGEFRRTQNWIGRPGSTLQAATFVPPPVTAMHAALDAFERYLHAPDEYPPLIRLALAHYQFEAIHPFVDGNGRVGRLLLILLLRQWGLLPQPLLYLSAYFEQHRQSYYEHLQAVSERGAWAEWVQFFLRGVAEQAQDTNARVKRLQDLQTQWRQQVLTTRKASVLLRVLDLLFEQPYVAAHDLQAKLTITHPTANNALRRLVELGIVQEATGRERGRLYVASDILKIVE